jgi:hypothetical protein
MTEQNLTEPAEADGQARGTKVWKRRGLLAAAWATVAAIVAKKTEQPAEAVVGGTQGTAFICGVNNTETAGGQMTWAGSPTSTVLLLGNDTAFVPTDASFPAAVGGWAGGTGGTFAGVANGVYGYTEMASGGNGVVGVNVGATGNGVYGESFNASFGVLGRNSGTGVGVRGEIPSGTSGNAIAIYGLNYSSYTGPGPGAGGFAIYGLSANGHGLVGATAAAGAAAVVGATNGVSGAYAAAFYGPVIVGGAFTVVGGPKSAAVPHPDGSHRLLYCVESPESWFEDFGEGTLECGQAEVTLDPDFAAVVDTEKYHVFLTQYDEHPDLCVAQRTPTGFRVLAKDDASTGAFSWRVVAKRKDIAGERLARITIPPEPTLPVPTPTPAPAPMRRP